jgi:hypothetical protein
MPILSEEERSLEGIEVDPAVREKLALRRQMNEEAMQLQEKREREQQEREQLREAENKVRPKPTKKTAPSEPGVHRIVRPPPAEPTTDDQQLPANIEQRLAAIEGHQVRLANIVQKMVDLQLNAISKMFRETVDGMPKPEACRCEQLAETVKRLHVELVERLDTLFEPVAPAEREPAAEEQKRSLAELCEDLFVRTTASPSRIDEDGRASLEWAFDTALHHCSGDIEAAIRIYIEWIQMFMRHCVTTGDVLNPYRFQAFALTLAQQDPA